MDARTQYSSVLVAYYAGVATDLPTISPYARQLARAPKSTEISEALLIQAYITDPFLSAKLAGVAHSRFFNGDRQTVYTIRELLDRVGARYARSLVREAPELPRHIDENLMGPYWAHCMAVALGAKRTAVLSARAACDEEIAYFAGMVHDLGYLLQIHYSPKMLPDVMRGLEAGEPHIDISSHTTHGAELARQWSLPPAAIAAINCHHDPRRCDEPRGRWLAEIIAVSEALIGAGSADAHELPTGTVFEEWMFNLGLSRQDLAPVQIEVARVYDECIHIVAQEHSLCRPTGLNHLRVVR